MGRGAKRSKQRIFASSAGWGQAALDNQVKVWKNARFLYAIYLGEFS